MIEHHCHRLDRTGGTKIYEGSIKLHTVVVEVIDDLVNFCHFLKRLLDRRRQRALEKASSEKETGALCTYSGSSSQTRQTSVGAKKLGSELGPELGG